MSEPRTTNIHLWPDFGGLTVFVLVLVAIFYFTGLQIQFSRNDVAGIYVSFDLAYTQNERRKTNREETSYHVPTEINDEVFFNDRY